MDEVTSGIKEKVIVRYPSILTDLSITDEYLTEIVNDIIDRFLMYTNREQFVHIYEQDLIDFDDPEDVDKYFWDEYDGYPVPPRLYRTLASVVVSAAKTVQDRNTTSAQRVTKLVDNGQEINFANELLHFFGSASDSEIFSDAKSIVDLYRVGTVVKDDNYRNNKEYFRNSLL